MKKFILLLVLIVALSLLMSVAVSAQEYPPAAVDYCYEIEEWWGILGYSNLGHCVSVNASTFGNNQAVEVCRELRYKGILDSVGLTFGQCVVSGGIIFP